jgi:predicted N-acetyltransferase YhbS
MQVTDLRAVLAIQVECYTSVAPESENCLRAKLLASPQSCYVAAHDGAVVGYLISVPGRFRAPPVLNAISYAVPSVPDTLHLHDLSVCFEARGAGVGGALFRKFLSDATKGPLNHLSLIAVQGSVSYWRRLGFERVEPEATLRRILSEYGVDAEYMERCLGADS